MIIREEAPLDYTAIHAVNESAFKTSAEANLVDALRRKANPIISLVAEDDGTIIGHIMFSPVTLSNHPDLKIMGLGPIAVLPKFQCRGVGSALVIAGLETCKELGFGAVIVLGHPGYYPRFGFSPAIQYGIRCEYEVPDEVFLVTELKPGFLEGATGIIKYHTAFKDV